MEGQSTMATIPKFSQLPLREGDPPYSAWGFYGEKDELGTLNRLSDELVVKSARQEIQSGVRISLNWPLSAQPKPSFGRQAFHQQITQKAPRIVNDDIWTFNTQSSSQWDGLRHFAYQKEQKFYNNVTLDDIHGEDKSFVNGIQAWSEKGIVGRGVLLDFHSWRLANNVDYNPFATGSIRLDQLKDVAKAQGTNFMFGDILIVRSGRLGLRAFSSGKKLTVTMAGYIEGYNELPKAIADQCASVLPPQLSGLEQSENMLQWIWENFSAVAGDQP